jgi:hypothetical protein
MPEIPDFTMPRDSAWFDPVTKRIDQQTGLEISADDWRRWSWYDVTTRAGYEPGVHWYVKLRCLGPSDA